MLNDTINNIMLSYQYIETIYVLLMICCSSFHNFILILIIKFKLFIPVNQYPPLSRIAANNNIATDKITIILPR